MASSEARSRSGRRWLPSGLRWRLTVWVAAVMLVSVAVIFYVVYNDTGTELRARSTATSPATPTSSPRRSRPHAGQSAQRRSPPAPVRYVRAQPYGATSTLLFVLVPGAPAAFNHPEIVGPRRARRGRDAGPAGDRERAGARGCWCRISATRSSRCPDVGRDASPRARRSRSAACTSWSAPASRWRSSIARRTASPGRSCSPAR